MLETSASLKEIEVFVEFVADVDVTQSLSAFLLRLFLFVLFMTGDKAKANYAEVQKRLYYFLQFSQKFILLAVNG